MAVWVLLPNRLTATSRYQTAEAGSKHPTVSAVASAAGCLLGAPTFKQSLALESQYSPGSIDAVTLSLL